MQLGMIGLGRMGGNMVRRLTRDGHRCVVFNRTPAARGFSSWATSCLRSVLPVTRSPTIALMAAWVMLPAGEITEAAITQLGELLDAG
jgi:6-phosphogluconate dehydrogenase